MRYKSKTKPPPVQGRLGPYTGPRGKYHTVETLYDRHKTDERITQYSEYYSPTDQEKPSEY
jgi:hypothetical protein